MGMFDSVNVKCPKCDSTMEFQSKAGDCRLKDYSINRVPLVIALNLDEATGECESCGTKVQIVYDSAPRFVSMEVVCV